MYYFRETKALATETYICFKDHQITKEYIRSDLDKIRTGLIPTKKVVLIALIWIHQCNVFYEVDVDRCNAVSINSLNSLSNERLVFKSFLNVNLKFIFSS
jgi:hypothetical protein